MSESRAKILVVDDEPASVASLCVILDHASDLVVKETGQDALDFLKHNQVDLILLDIELPDISGFNVCRQLKSAGNTTPIIFLTGYEGLLFEAQAFDAGAVDYLVKPASPYRVLMRVNAHIPKEHRIEMKPKA